MYDLFFTTAAFIPMAVFSAFLGGLLYDAIEGNRNPNVPVRKSKVVTARS